MLDTVELDDKVEVLGISDDIRDDVLADALDETLKMLLKEVLEDFILELWVFVSSSSFFKLLAKFPRLSKMISILGTSGGSIPNNSITLSKPLLRHPRTLKMLLRILAPSRQEPS